MAERATTPVYRPHEVEWTPELIGRFWDGLAADEAQTKLYFSAHSGAAIVRRALREAPLRERRVLDFGCGRGDLLAQLFALGIAAEGLEFSTASARAVERRFAGEPLLHGVTVATGLPSAIPDASVDFVFLVEVVEHLDDATLGEALAEVRRVLAPGGLVLATTPNAEDLSLDHVRCPECGAGFHRWQHLRSLSAAEIARLFAAHGFERRVAEAVRWGETRAQRVVRALRRRAALPHLLYVGRRAG